MAMKSKISTIPAVHTSSLESHYIICKANVNYNAEHNAHDMSWREQGSTV